MLTDQNIKKYILLNLGLSQFSSFFSYGNEEHSVIHIKKSNFIDLYNNREYGKIILTPNLLKNKLFYIFGRNIIKEENNKVIIDADLFASAFYFISRFEEIHRPEVRDSHGRFIGKESLLFKSRMISRPIIDEYRTFFISELSKYGIGINSLNFENKIIVTHDVDYIKKYSLKNLVVMMIKSLMGKVSIDQGIFAFKLFMRLEKDPYYTFNYLITTDRNLKGSFTKEVIYFFMSGGKSSHDGHYSIFSSDAKRLIKKITDSGALVGLHSSYDAGTDPAKIRNEKMKLEDVVGYEIIHNRHHWLNFREPEHARYLEDAGIKHDYSMGYADIAGFRAGTCRPYKSWDFHNDHQGELTYHPLILMDNTLSAKKYMNLSYEEALIYMKKLFDVSNKYSGDYSILWHNTVFTDDYYHKKLYEKIPSVVN